MLDSSSEPGLDSQPTTGHGPYGTGKTPRGPVHRERHGSCASGSRRGQSPALRALGLEQPLQERKRYSPAPHEPPGGDQSLVRFEPNAGVALPTRAPPATPPAPNKT